MVSILCLEAFQELTRLSNINFVESNTRCSEINSKRQYNNKKRSRNHFVPFPIKFSLNLQHPVKKSTNYSFIMNENHIKFKVLTKI